MLAIILLIYLIQINLTTSIFNTDSTLDIITWNLEHFPKNNSLTIDSLVTIIKHLDHIVITNELFDNVHHAQTIIVEDFFSGGWSAYENIDSAHCGNTVENGRIVDWGLRGLDVRS